MQIRATYIVERERRFRVLFVSYTNKYFVTTHIVGQVMQITEKEALELIQNSKFP